MHGINIVLPRTDLFLRYRLKELVNTVSYHFPKFVVVSYRLLYQDLVTTYRMCICISLYIHLLHSHCYDLCGSCHAVSCVFTYVVVVVVVYSFDCYIVYVFVACMPALLFLDVFVWLLT